jgi:Xaa-Pro aminopeptidase
VTDVLVYADSMRSPELRHEVPLAVPDPFLYLEHERERHAVVVSFEIDRIEALGIDVKAHPLEEFGYDELLAQGKSRDEAEREIALRACRSVGLEAAAVPPTFPVELADFLRSHGIEVLPDRGLFDGRRRVKNEFELAGIRRAQRGCEAAMATACELLGRAEASDGTLTVDREPLTCERLKLVVEGVFGEHGLSAEEFVVSHGPQTAIGHEMGSGPIAPNEPIVFDLFPRDRESGCYADMTRTFVVGTPDDELVRYQELCREALDRSLEAIRPGVAGSEVHRLVCDFFHEHGFPTQLSKQPGEVLRDGFYHGLGHGVGLEVHEKPALGRGPDELVAGDVVAVEPGLYRQGYGGCRLEDLVLVTDDGAQNLSDYPYDLEPAA